MTKQSIRIERLEIRLKGVSAQSARAAAVGLGRELASRLAWPQNLPRGRRAVEISRIEGGVFRLSGDTPSSELRRTIARGVAASIEPKLK